MKQFLVFLFLVFSTHILQGQEICDNGVDDDGDGRIDRLDTADCRCSGFLSGVTSLIPNPSFEERLRCPTGYSQMEFVESWIQASDATTDYYNCGYTPPAIPAILHPPAATLPLPNEGTGYIGCISEENWEEFAATCLDVPLSAGENYQLHLYLSKVRGPQNFNLTVYGSPNCSDLPWNTTGCPVGIGDWEVLGSVNVPFPSPTDSSWQQVSLSFTPPADIMAIAVGGPCGGQVTNVWPGNMLYSCYVYMDEFTLAAADSFQKNATITETGKWCSKDLQLDARIDTIGGSWQWYRSGIALPGETTASLDLMDYGTDAVYTAVYSLGADCVAIDHTMDTTDPANQTPELLLFNEDTLVCAGTVIPIRARGTPGYHYQWWPTTGVSDPNALTPDITAENDTTIRYVVTASYPGCPDISSQSLLVEVDSPYLVSFQAEPEAVCAGRPVYFYPRLDSSVERLSWDFANQKPAAQYRQSVYQHAFEAAGVYPVTLYSSFRVCPDTSHTDTITVYPFPEVDLGDDSSICLHGQPVYLKNLRNAPLSPYRQVWSTGDTTGVLKVVHPGVYTLSVTTEPIGCTTTESVTITKDCYLDIPNAFTPNGDGHNDYFLPRQLLTESVTHFHMQVFNRWGQRIFETNRLDGRGWDGRFNDKAQPLGVYLYRIEADFSNGRKEQYEGNVTLIR